MSPMMANILVAAVGIAGTAAIIEGAIAHFKLFKLKAEIQEDLANMYTPEILGVQDEELKTDGEEKVEKSETDDTPPGNQATE